MRIYDVYKAVFAAKDVAALKTMLTEQKSHNRRYIIQQRINELNGIPTGGNSGKDKGKAAVKAHPAGKKAAPAKSAGGKAKKAAGGPAQGAGANGK